MAPRRQWLIGVTLMRYDSRHAAGGTDGGVKYGRTQQR